MGQTSCLKNPKNHIQSDIVMKDHVRHDKVIRWKATLSVSINVYNLWWGPIASALYIDSMDCIRNCRAWWTWSIYLAVIIIPCQCFCHSLSVQDRPCGLYQDFISLLTVQYLDCIRTGRAVGVCIYIERRIISNVAVCDKLFHYWHLQISVSDTTDQQKSGQVISPANSRIYLIFNNIYYSQGDNNDVTFVTI